ncbi:hypothetical protein [Methylomagnum sp.]
MPNWLPIIICQSPRTDLDNFLDIQEAIRVEGLGAVIHQIQIDDGETDIPLVGQAEIHRGIGEASVGKGVDFLLPTDFPAFGRVDVEQVPEWVGFAPGVRLRRRWFCGRFGVGG